MIKSYRNFYNQIAIKLNRFENEANEFQLAEQDHNYVIIKFKTMVIP